MPGASSLSLHRFTGRIIPTPRRIYKNGENMPATKKDTCFPHVCQLCPHQCGAERTSGRFGFCRAQAQVKVARAALHFWEEPCISGEQGSGTVFFSHCTMRCVYCQNHIISQEGFGKEISLVRLKEIFFRLEKEGAHNLNLVSPTQYTSQIIEALTMARREGLSLPVVWNSNGYELPSTLRRLEGLVDVYLPDLKYADEALAYRYSGVRNYFATATAAIREMWRQVGAPQLDRRGIIRRGLIIRHLVLPGHVENSLAVADWIAANLPHQVYVSVMAQYTPCYHADRFPEIKRRLTPEEYDAVVDYFLDKGLENGYIQELEAAETAYVPPWDLTGVQP